jgi:hypothetical protein
MTITLILFIFFGGIFTVNRAHYGDTVACRHKQWYQTNFPGAAMPMCKPIVQNRLKP